MLEIINKILSSIMGPSLRAEKLLIFDKVVNISIYESISPLLEEYQPFLIQNP